MLKYDITRPTRGKPLVAKFAIKDLNTNHTFLKLRKKYISGCQSPREPLPQISYLESYRSRSITNKHQSLHSDSAISNGEYDPDSEDNMSYLNNYSHPYDWRVVEYSKKNPKCYMILSKKGIMIHRLNKIETISFEQFQLDKQRYNKLQNIGFFRDYVKVKSFLLWKRVFRQKQMKITQSILLKAVFLDRHLQKSMIDLKLFCHRITQLGYFRHRFTYAFQLKQWIEMRDYYESEFIANLSKSRAIIFKVVLDSCHYQQQKFTEETKIKLNKNNFFSDNSGIIVGDNTTFQMPQMQKLKINEFQAHLEQFIKLVDSMLSQSYYRLFQLATEEFVNQLKVEPPDEDSLAKSHIIIEILMGSNCLIFEPSREQVTQLFINIVNNGQKGISKGQRYCSDVPDIKSLLTHKHAQTIDHHIQLLRASEKYDLKIILEVDTTFKRIEEETHRIKRLVMDNLETKQLNQDQILQKFRRQKELIQAIDNTIEVGLFQLDCRQIKLSLMNKLKQSLIRIAAQMPQNFGKNSQLGMFLSNL